MDPIEIFTDPIKIPADPIKIHADPIKIPIDTMETPSRPIKIHIPYKGPSQLEVQNPYDLDGVWIAKFKIPTLSMELKEAYTMEQKEAYQNQNIKCFFPKCIFSKRIFSILELRML